MRDITYLHAYRLTTVVGAADKTNTFFEKSVLGTYLSRDYRNKKYIDTTYM